MAVILVNLFLWLISVYLIAGLIFYFPFIKMGIEKIDQNAKDTTIGFKLIILPGVIAFWPFLLRKWVNSKSDK